MNENKIDLYNDWSLAMYMYKITGLNYKRHKVHVDNENKVKMMEKLRKSTSCKSPTF